MNLTRKCSGKLIFVFFSFLSFCCSVPAQGQRMEATGADLAPYTPSNLISDVFLGNGVEILDIQYSGSTGAVGYFDHGQNAIALKRGLVLTTGIAKKVTGDGRDGAQDNNDVNQMYRTDPDLTAIAKGAPIRNVSKYTITFIPTHDTLRFRYVFASEEYPEFVCSEFNDVFGFFISGPGFNGSFENGAENIALIPGTILPVTINNVNGGGIGVWGDLANCTSPNGSLGFSHFFNDNQNTNQQPVFDGYTQVFQAEAVVTPCQVYTIKIAIADVTDEGYDSGVFLEAKSFGTSQLLVEANTSSPDGAIVEGCAEGLITFKLTEPASQDYIIDYNVLGTATNGVDYAPIPGTLTIPRGQDSVSIVIRALEDGIPEPIETVIIDVQKDLCNRDTVIVFIRDNDLPTPDLRDSAVCEGQRVILDGTLGVQTPQGLIFSNEQSLPLVPALTPVISQINVSGVRPTELTDGMIDKICLSIQHSKPEDLDIYLVAPNGKFILLTSDNGVGGTNYFRTCFSPDALTRIDDVSAQAPYTGTFKPEGDWTDLWSAASPANGSWQLLIIDDEFGNNGVLTDWSISFKPTYSLSYHWTPEQAVACVDCPVVEVTVDHLGAGEYILAATDIYGCRTQGDAELSIIEPLPVPQVDCINATPNSVTFGWPQVTGANSIEIQVNGGNWEIFNGDLQDFTIGNLGLDEEVTLGFRVNGICPGEPSFFTCRSLNCQPPSIFVDDVRHVSCPGGNDGSVNISANGLGNIFLFELDGMSNTNGSFGNLLPGRYQVEVTDELGCKQNIRVDVDEPDPIEIQLLRLQDPSCAGYSDGSLEITALGGTSPYQFFWSNGASGASIGNLFAGTFQVTLTDANGCPSQQTYQINEPPALLATLSVVDVDCHGAANGSVSLFPFGGTPPYNFQWNPGSGPNSGSALSGLSGGNYAYTVSDGKGCVFSGTTVVNEYDRIQLVKNVEDIRCFGETTGSASITPSGGAGNFSFRWSNGSTDDEISNLGSGTYLCSVNDANGCVIVDTILIRQPGEIIVASQVDSANCYNSSDGAAQVNVSGGVADYEILWEDGTVDFDRNELQAGFYVVTVTDGNGCEKLVELEIPAPEKIDIDFIAQNPLCFNTADGKIECTANGGTGTLNYNWQNFPISSERLENLSAGQYSLTVTDRNGCTEQAVIVLQNPDSISILADLTNVTCFGERNGAIKVSRSSGGTGTLEFLWTGPGSFVSAEAEISFLRAGDYTVEISDQNRCVNSRQLTIYEPAELTGEITTTPVSCMNRRDGNIVVSPEGGTAPYSLFMRGTNYNIDRGIEGLGPGSYDVRLVDANNCIYDMNGVVVDEAAPLEVDLGSDQLINFGDSITIIADVESTFPISTFQWEENSEIIMECGACSQYSNQPENNAVIKLTVVDEKGCITDDMVRIYVKKEKNILVPSAFTPNNDTANDRLLVHGKYPGSISLFRIFDRWGEIIFEDKDFQINDPNAGWDGFYRGKAMSSGVFVWYAEVEFDDGTKEAFKGSTTLIR